MQPTVQKLDLIDVADLTKLEEKTDKALNQINQNSNLFISVRNVTDKQAHSSCRPYILCGFGKPNHRIFFDKHRFREKKVIIQMFNDIRLQLPDFLHFYDWWICLPGKGSASCPRMALPTPVFLTAISWASLLATPPSPPILQRHIVQISKHLLLNCQSFNQTESSERFAHLYSDPLEVLIFPSFDTSLILTWYFPHLKSPSSPSPRC